MRVVYPNIMKLSYDNTRTQTDRSLAELEAIEGRAPIDLFGEFYEMQNNQPMSEEQTEYMRELIAAAREEER
jgi:exonuclease SbcD